MVPVSRRLIPAFVAVKVTADDKWVLSQFVFVKFKVFPKLPNVLKLVSVFRPNCKQVEIVVDDTGREKLETQVEPIQRGQGRAGSWKDTDTLVLVMPVPDVMSGPLEVFFRRDCGIFAFLNHQQVGVELV